MKYTIPLFLLIFITSCGSTNELYSYSSIQRSKSCGHYCSCHNTQPNNQSVVGDILKLIVDISSEFEKGSHNKLNSQKKCK